MRNRLLGYVVGAASAAALILGSAPAHAGQAGSITTINSGVTYNGSGSTTITTLGTGSAAISITYTDNSIVSVTGGSVDSTRVFVSLEITDNGYHGYSPSNNLATFAGTALTNTAIIGSGGGTSSGIIQTQQTLGNANVSVSANSLLDGSALASLAAVTTFSPNGETAAMVLNPAFAISNSALAARVLAIEAMTGLAAGLASAGGTASPLAIDIVGGEIHEMSPENNIASFAGDLTNSLQIDNVQGIGQFQQQTGNANVQTSFNTIVFTSGVTGLPSFHP
jgi:hypothetical protein